VTTYVPFSPSLTAVPPWTAQLTLDGLPYQAVAAWNIAGQRWYLSLTDSNANVVWYGPLIGSPLSSDIQLAPGIFSASTLVYRVSTGNIETNQ